MTTEAIDMTPDYERIPLKERLDFQHILIEKMLGKDFRQKPRENQILIEIDWAEKYAKKVSQIIDNKQNAEIRDLILKLEYDKAADLIVLLLE